MDEKYVVLIGIIAFIMISLIIFMVLFATSLDDTDTDAETKADNRLFGSLSSLNRNATGS